MRNQFLGGAEPWRKICVARPYFAAMAKKTVSAPAAPAPANRPPYMLIEEIRVQGYKSLVDATLHVRPLTLLAGTNSSGKSSIMQPLLLIKQTMEAPYQPAGALVLDGAHVQAETAGELVSKVSGETNKSYFLRLIAKDGIPLGPLEKPQSLELLYVQNGVNFDIAYQKHTVSRRGDLVEMIPLPIMSELMIESPEGGKTKVKIGNDDLGVVDSQGGLLKFFFNSSTPRMMESFGPFSFIEILASLFHIPGLRRKPERSHPATTFSNHIRGTFDLYVAGTVSQWQQQENTEALTKLNDYLRRLGLTDSVTAKVKNANEVELSVSRLPAGSKGKPRKADMVNIADVGIGVSQVLPILVALIAAQEGQIVYVEQPELHLHPRAQVAMAELLAEAANRGVRVIVETHSSLLLLTIQTLIAQDRIKNTDVALHWFKRDAKGATQVTYVEPDEDGAYGEWPEDFGDVELKAQDAYLTAVGMRHFGKAVK
jgi:predicted ATPase